MATKKKATKKTVTKKKTVKKAATKKKAVTKKKPATKRKATANTKTKVKARKPRAASKYPRGFQVTEVEREYNFGHGSELFTVFEVAGPKMDKPRYFVDEASAKLYIDKVNAETVINKSFETAVKRASTKSERKELQASKELSELVPALEEILPAAIRDAEATRPEDTDK